ncbi:dodecin domain-containing protein [Arthrobacter sp. KBS0703]|uniref:dodecin domain-containing protein n=1 Tax=Arthrobacter sp. KBS0703 TaxID=1955698 RepID=UPI0037BFBE04
MGRALSLSRHDPSPPPGWVWWGSIDVSCSVVGSQPGQQDPARHFRAWVKEQKVEIADGNVVAWHVVLEVTFVLED